MKKRNTKRIIIGMMLMLILLLCACADKGAGADKKATGNTNAEKRKVIIDTDTGADDSSALILAAMCDDIEIVGVTVLVGNVDLEQSAKNALMALEMAGCDAPVYKGSNDTINGIKKTAFSVFGEDGMGEADLVHPKREAEEEDAVDFILDTVKSNPGEIEIVALGPATNIAKAIEKDPETMKKVKMIWSMGTAGLGPGNASPVAEFNVYADAEAYKIMLDSDIPITIIGLDMCADEAQWTDDQFVKLSGSGETGKFVAESFGKIREFYKNNGSETVMNCDALAMMCVTNPDFVNDRTNTHASCIIEKGETYAQVIFYKEGFTYDIANNDFNYNVCLVTDVKKALYFDNYLKALH